MAFDGIECAGQLLDEKRRQQERDPHPERVDQEQQGALQRGAGGRRHHERRAEERANTRGQRDRINHAEHNG